MKRKKYMDNRGSALLTVILVIAFLTILATTLLYISGMNFQIKQADYQNKKNFYTGETALEEIKAELMEDVSEAAVLAYNDMAMTYAKLDTEDVRELEYKKCFIKRLEEVWNDELTPYGGNWATYLSDYHTDGTLTLDLSYDSNADGVLTSSEILSLDPNAGTARIRGIRMEYINPDNKLATVITTDFEISAPAFDWKASGSRQSLETGVTVDNAKLKNMVKPSGSVIYTNWKKE